MLKGARGRRGFTLIETVVTVGIVATLAAVVVPQVVRQFDAGDTARIQNDLKNIQTGIETYSVNIKLLPGDIDDLVNQIVAGDSTINTSTDVPEVGSTVLTLWKGPYLDATLVGSATLDNSLATGVGGRILDSFVCYAIGDFKHGVSEGSGTAAADDAACPSGSTGQKYLAVQIIGITCDETAGSTFMALNEVFDGVSEATPKTAGKLRCQTTAESVVTDTDVDVVYYLAVPIS